MKYNIKSVPKGEGGSINNDIWNLKLFNDYLYQSITFPTLVKNRKFTLGYQETTRVHSDFISVPRFTINQTTPQHEQLNQTTPKKKPSHIKLWLTRELIWKIIIIYRSWTNNCYRCIPTCPTTYPEFTIARKIPHNTSTWIWV